MKCWQCMEKVVSSSQSSSFELADARDAITWVPVWQQLAIGGQSVVALTALPQCLECMRDAVKSTANGKLLIA